MSDLATRIRYVKALLADESPLRRAPSGFAAGQLDPSRGALIRALLQRDGGRGSGYDPNQPRVPAGNPDGGQWTSTGGAGQASGSSRVETNLIDASGMESKAPPAAGSGSAGPGLVLNDAEPDNDWIPNQHYASRRGGRGGPGRPLTPGEYFRLQTFTSLHRELAQLVPHHPAAAPGASTSNWVPTSHDIQIMQAHVAQARAYVAAVQAANQQYPNLANRPAQRHHLFPKYLGGPSSGPRVPLPRAYHQVITNAFRQAYPYGLGRPSRGKTQSIMQGVYTKYPLPW